MSGIRRADERRSMRTAKARGPGCRRYSQALRRCVWARPGLKASPIRKGEGGQKELGSQESADIGRENHCAGKAGCFGCPVLPLCFTRASSAAQRANGCQPAPGLPCALCSDKGRDEKQSSGDLSRENAQSCLLFARCLKCELQSDARAHSPSLRVIGPRFARTRWLAMTAEGEAEVLRAACVKVSCKPSARFSIRSAASVLLRARAHRPRR